jgi:carbon monoxide dehydrogenase subunit G
MKMNGEFRVATDRETVWQALNDPAVLKDCLPGCQEIEKTSETEMTATLAIKVGPVKATFKGAVTFSDIDPPNGYTLSGQGQGGAAGFASGEAKVALVTEGSDTVVQYDVDAKVGGKLAQIGSRLIDSTSKKLAKQFFDALAEKLGGAEGDTSGAEQPTPAAEAASTGVTEPTTAPATPPAAEPETAPPAAATPASPTTSAETQHPAPLHPAARRTGLPALLWVPALITVAVILILVFTGVI